MLETSLSKSASLPKACGRAGQGRHSRVPFPIPSSFPTSAFAGLARGKFTMHSHGYSKGGGWAAPLNFIEESVPSCSALALLDSNHYDPVCECPAPSTTNTHTLLPAAGIEFAPVYLAFEQLKFTLVSHIYTRVNPCTGHLMFQLYKNWRTWQVPYCLDEGVALLS